MVTHEMAELASAFGAPFNGLGRNAEHDGITVLASWPSVPPELIRAAGFTPVYARGAPTPTPAADAVLETGVFPGRIHQLFEAALSGRLAHVAAIVLPRSSDADYKGYLYLKELERQGVPLPPVLLLDLLQSAGPDVPAYNAARLREMLEQLGQLAGRRGSPDTLGAQLARSNVARASARRIAALRTRRPRLAGTEAVPLLGAFWQLQPGRYCALAERAGDAIAARAALPGARLLLAGAPPDSTAVHAALESLQAIVVAEPGPFGNGAACADVETSTDPFLALASWQMRNVMSPRSSGEMLRQQVQLALAHVDAAVVLLPPSDARFGWEYPSLRRLLDDSGIPHMALALEPEAGLEPAQLLRVHALLRKPRASTLRHG